MRILISGAAGNLGRLLTRHLVDQGLDLTLMWHQRPISPDLTSAPGVRVVRADLDLPGTLGLALNGANVVVHLAGKLFAPHPASYLARTNIEYMLHLIQAARQAGVRRLVFVSFPQVEGPTTPDHPSMGRLDGRPVGLHAKTRLEAERQLVAAGDLGLEAVIVRSGTVYGPEVKLVRAAKRLMSLGLLAVWPRPTWYHLISSTDFVRGLANAIRLPGLSGIYPLGDDRPIRLQALLDELAERWGFRRAWHLPAAAFSAAAWAVESAAWAAHTPAPLTRDIVRLAQVDHAMDTHKMKAELLPDLVYPNIEQGLTTL